MIPSKISHWLSAVAIIAPVALAAKDEDLVKQMPQFAPTSFNVYSGYLEVPGPFKLNDYDSLSIHYQFHESQGNPKTDPVATWHNGGPGSSSIDLGLFTEMGYFQLDDQGSHVNPYAWNKIANMLYLESPAGSGSSEGFSTCNKGGKATGCAWDDVSQAEAYAHTLAAFYKAFPEFLQNDFYLTGESYFGQYGPNIANYITSNPTTAGVTIPLKGIALGNACWGGDATTVNCNGPNEAQNDADMFYGKGLSSKKLYKKIYEQCKFPQIDTACEALLNEQYKQVGPHNIYNIYDNCPQTQKFLARTGMTMLELTRLLRSQLSTDYNSSAPSLLQGGYDWSCGGEDAARTYLGDANNQRALHLHNQGASAFSYKRSGPASVTLYPTLVKKLRILIYNGDADGCVPYKGNEEWIDSLADTGAIVQKAEWRPWYSQPTPNSSNVPAGYVTTYNVSGAPENDFSFVTIRLAGHMVPTFQPTAALAFFQRFLNKQPF
eukprot:m.1054590 g.1054590  ORF g.1054590 m.1054590 type:complete len:491 (+) comp24190_c0_seq8:136-1608(+)